MTPNYDQIYHYISETLKGRFPPELETIDAFIILKLIEELKELWNAGRQRSIDEISAENLSKVTSPDFYTYLQSKGINNI